MSFMESLKNRLYKCVDIVSENLSPNVSESGGVYTPVQWSRKQSLATTEPGDSIEFNNNRRTSVASSMISNNSTALTQRRNTLMPETLSKNQLKMSNSAKSVASGSFKNENIGLGSLLFTLIYNTFTNKLQVSIDESKNMSSLLFGGNCNPFLKIFLDPVNYDAFEVKLSRNARLNVVKVFNGVKEENLKQMTMNAKVYDSNSTFDARIIGEINYSLNVLSNVAIVDNKRTVQIERTIEPFRDIESLQGMLMVSLNLDFNKSKMIIYIITGKDLKIIDKKESLNPYCRLDLSVPKRKIDSKRTTVKTTTNNPFWNESFTFYVTKNDFKVNITLSIKVYDKGTNSQNCIGEILFSSEGSGKESKHWLDMIHNEKETMTEWHILKSRN